MNVLIAPVKKLFMPGYLVSKIKIGLKRALEKVFHIKPKDPKDYYSVGRFLVSKPLISMLIFVTGIVGTYYLLVVSPPEFLSKNLNGVKTYKYSSIPLKFVSDMVRIKADSGYIAYYGDVEKGQVKGNGTLYTKSGDILYVGKFDENEFNGSGSLYRKGNLLYEGEFLHNVYQGEGTLFRENGSKEYVGEFQNGQKSGAGEIYDTSNNLVFAGDFLKDQIMYEELIGKTTADIAGMYTGKRIIYYEDSSFVVDMKDINALYVGSSEESYLDDSVKVNQIFVKNDYCVIEGKKISKISELDKTCSFEGYSAITMEEAIGLLPEQVMTEADFEDVLRVTEYPEDEIYLEVFEYDDIQYTFYSLKKSDTFMMYSIQK